ncbi:hypothetical protein ACOMHN_043646 [Nucella lapillus]
MESRQDLQSIIPELERCIEEIGAAGRQLTAHQRSRQQDIWMLVKVALKQKQVKPGLPRSNSRSSGGSTAVSSSSLTSMPSDYASTSLQSMRILEDSRHQNQRLQEMMTSLMQEQDECMSILFDIDQLSLQNTPTTPTTTATTPTTTATTHSPLPNPPDPIPSPST